MLSFSSFITPSSHSIIVETSFTVQPYSLFRDSKHNGRYFPIFSSSLATPFCFLGNVILSNSIVFFDVSPNFRSGISVMQLILTGFFQSQKSFFPSFLITFPRSQFVVNPFVSSRSSPFSIVHFTTNIFKVFLCRLTYSVPTSFSLRQEVVHCFSVLPT